MRWPLGLAPLVAALLVAGCNSSAEPSPASADRLPAGYAWAGGDETGIRFAVPGDWVQRDDTGEDLRDRGGVAFIDRVGAELPQLWEAHLIASCDAMQGVTTIDHLAAVMAANRSRYHNPEVEVVVMGDVELVRSEYDIENDDGELEHWYAYNLLAGTNRMCAVTLVTPLDGADRIHIDEAFETIGPTIEVAAQKD